MPFVHWFCDASPHFHSLFLCVHHVSTFLQMFRCTCLLTPCHSMTLIGSSIACCCFCGSDTSLICSLVLLDVLCLLLSLSLFVTCCVIPPFECAPICFACRAHVFFLHVNARGRVCVAEWPYCVLYIISQLQYFFHILNVNAFVCICIEGTMFICRTFAWTQVCMCTPKCS